ncbi:hypothetical protein ACFSO7_05145 [Bacillus sp. CGMCC 1.16607]|uniref:hypothetical protein n=1 Tax=Bacillus sp. CGMCC 1.16607 TaxID=3351842 RepID=UPI00363ECD19
MKQLMNQTKKKAALKERTAVLKLEMDYELATLFDAIKDQNEEQKTKCINKLEKIRQELVGLQAL